MTFQLKVWKAEAESICGYDGTVVVAVKTTKENAPEKEKLDLLQEMKVMQTIGHHPNVVTLLGVCTEKGLDDLLNFSLLGNNKKLQFPVEIQSLQFNLDQLSSDRQPIEDKNYLRVKK